MHLDDNAAIKFIAIWAGLSNMEGTYRGVVYIHKYRDVTYQIDDISLNILASLLVEGRATDSSSLEHLALFLIGELAVDLNKT